VSTSSASFPASLSACGSNYTGNSGVGMQASWASGNTSTNWQQTYWTTYPTGVVIGFAFTPTIGTLSSFAQVDFFSLDGHLHLQICGSTTTSSCTESSSTKLLFDVEQSDSTRHGYTQLTSGSTYWITTENLSSGTDVTNVYGPCSSSDCGASIGSLLSTTTTTDTVYAGAGAHVIYWGDTGSATPGTTVTAVFGNVITNWAQPITFPLLPPTATGVCTLALLGIGPC
jgi:hypothetical protein